MASAGKSCSRSRPETLSHPLHTCTSGGLWGPGALHCSWSWFSAPTALSPESVVLGQLSSVHPPAAAVKAEEARGLPCREMKAVPADRGQQRWGCSRRGAGSLCWRLGLLRTDASHSGESPDKKVFDLNYCFRLAGCFCIFVFNQQLSISWGFVYNEEDISRTSLLQRRNACGWALLDASGASIK